jgi:H+/gluconate symporter-like permease
VAGIFATALYGAGLAFGVFARLEWFQRLLALATAAALVSGVVMLPRPPPAQRLDPEKAHIEVTVYDPANQPLPGAAVACSVLDVNYLEDADRDQLRRSLAGDFSRTDENGKATIELDGAPMEQFYVCAAAMPNMNGVPPLPPAFSDVHFVPPVGVTFPASVHFAR